MAFYSPLACDDDEHHRWAGPADPQHRVRNLRAGYPLLRAVYALQLCVLVPASVQGLPQRLLLQLHGVLLRVLLPVHGDGGSGDRYARQRHMVSQSDYFKLIYILCDPSPHTDVAYVIHEVSLKRIHSVLKSAL